MRKFGWMVGLVLVVAALDAKAAVLVGTNNDGSGGYVLGNQAGDFSGSGTTFVNIGWAQGFTLNQSVVANTLTVYLNDAFDSSAGGATVNMQLTNMIGAGTTAANVLASGTQAFPSTPSGGHLGVDFNLGSLVLGAGTYYIVLTSDSPVTHLAVQDDLNDGFNCILGELCGNVGGWGSGGSLIPTGTGSIGSGPFIAFGSSSNGTGPALTDFDPTGTPSQDNANFVLEGRLPAVAAPEPATLAIVGLGLVGFGLIWRRRRAA